MKLRHLPNLITLSRIALAPFVGWLVLQDQRTAAAVLFILVAATDAVDGFLAKNYGWQSRLGGILDPLADKLLMLLSAASLWWVGLLPDWFIGLIVGRDLLIVLGALAYHYWISPFVAEPSPISKMTMAIQASMLTALMLKGTLGINEHLCQLLLAATTVLIVSSGVHYVGRYTRRAVAIRRQRAQS